RALEFAAAFTGDPYQHVGFGTDFSGSGPWAMISTGTGGGLYARTSIGFASVDTPLPASLLGGSHVFRIEWLTDEVNYYVDGSSDPVVTHTISPTAPLRPLVSDYQSGRGRLTLDWVRM